MPFWPEVNHQIATPPTIFNEFVWKFTMDANMDFANNSEVDFISASKKIELKIQKTVFLHQVCTAYINVMMYSMHVCH